MSDKFCIGCGILGDFPMYGEYEHRFCTQCAIKRGHKIIKTEFTVESATVVWSTGNDFVMNAKEFKEQIHAIFKEGRLGMKSFDEVFKEWWETEA